MKYNDKYLRVNDKNENGGMFKGEECACVICKDPTPWHEPSFKVHICSDECYSEFSREVYEYMRLGIRILEE